MIPNITQQSFGLLVIFFDTLDGKFLGKACQNKSQCTKSQHVSPIFKLIRYQSIMFFSQTFFDSVVLFFSRKMFGNILFQTFYGGTVPLFQGGHGVMDRLKCLLAGIAHPGSIPVTFSGKFSKLRYDKLGL